MLYRDTSRLDTASDHGPSDEHPPALIRLLRIAMGIRKRERPPLTIEEAMDRAIEENPGLYDQYLQLVAWCARSNQPLPN